MNTTEILQGLKKPVPEMPKLELYKSYAEYRQDLEFASNDKLETQTWNTALDAAIAALGEGDGDARRYAAMDMPHPSNYERHMDFQAVYKTWCTVNYSMIWKAIYNWQCIFDGVSKVKVGRTKGQNIKFVQLCFIDDHHGDWFNLGCSAGYECPAFHLYYTCPPEEKELAIKIWNTRAKTC